MPKQEASLRNWHFEWLPPPEDCQIAIGEVYGHPKFRDGRRIHTSQIVNFNANYGIVETLHTFYRLEDYSYESAEALKSSKLEGEARESSRDVPKDPRPLRK